MTACKEQFLENPIGTKTTLEDVLDAFEFLDDWEERYAYIVDLGKQLPAFPGEARIEENYVHGCQSQVWLIHHYDEDSGKLFLLIDSDAIIVRGLAAIILVALTGKPPATCSPPISTNCSSNSTCSATSLPHAATACVPWLARSVILQPQKQSEPA